MFVKLEVWVMGFQELCLLCYETQWLRHSQAERVAQFVVFRLLYWVVVRSYLRYRSEGSGG